MTTQKTAGKKRINQPLLIRWGQQLAIPVVFFLLVLFFVDFRSILEFSTDEGINLMLGMLTHKGYPLYSAIWSDQPPLFPYILAGAFELFGYSVGVGRILILFSSTVMVWAGYEIIRRIWNKSVAFFSVLALILAPRFIILSVAVMFGLPSISFGLVSLLCIILWHDDKRTIWLIASSLLLTLGILTKLLIGLVAPVFFTGLLIQSYTNFRQNKDPVQFWKPLVIWAASLFIFLVPGVLMIGLEHLPQIIDVHAVASDEIIYSGQKYTLNYHLQSALPIILLAVLGVISSLTQKKWLIIYLAFWAVAGYILLSFHLPVWYHHQLYVTVPLALLAGVGIHHALDYLSQLFRPGGDGRKWKGLLALIILFTMVFSPIDRPLFSYLHWPPTLKTVGLSKQLNVSRTIRAIRQYAPDTRWIITDRPIYAFMAGAPVPPEIAVFSQKRLLTDYISEQDIIKIIQTYNPEQVLLGRFEYEIIDNFLNPNYTLIDQELGVMRLYVRNDILP